ncbi:unnamed protein product [Closterium sp. NIES-54]
MVLSLLSSTSLPPSLLSPPPHQTQPQLQLDSPHPASSSYSEQTNSFTERREPESRPASPVRAVRIGRRVPRPRPSLVPSTHIMALRPSSVPLRVPLPPPHAYSLPTVPGPGSDLALAELVDFSPVCRLDYATSLVPESESNFPPSVGGECALGTDVLEDRQEDFECLAAAVSHLVAMLLAPEGDPDAPDIPTLRSYAEAITGLYSSQWQTAMDAEMASWKPTCTYVDAIPPPGANIVDGMWIFRVKRPPGSPHVFKARYVARGFSQRQGVDFFHTLSPTPKMTTIWGSMHEEIWLRRPPGFTGSFSAGTQWSLRRPVYGLRQAPHKWHDTLRRMLAALGFAPSTADPSLFLRTNILMPPFYVLVILARYVVPKRHWPEHWEVVKRVLRYLCITSRMRLVLGGRGPVVITGHADASWVDNLAMQRSLQGYTFSLGSGSVSWWSTRSSSFLSSSYEAEIYAGAMAAQELCWFTYLLTDLGEWPRSSPVMYVDNEAMIALCKEHKMEHRTKHIALRYFLARELQQRGQLRLAYSEGLGLESQCVHFGLFSARGVSEVHWLAYNVLFGPPTPLSSPSCAASLSFLHLSSNRLSGPIPATISSFKQLKRLHLDNNALTGAIPASVSNMKWLQILWLFKNSLTGSIPAVWLARIQQVLLAGNQLSGAVPAALSKLKKRSFKPGNGNLCGTPLPACA